MSLDMLWRLLGPGRDAERSSSEPDSLAASATGFPRLEGWPPRTDLDSRVLRFPVSTEDFCITAWDGSKILRSKNESKDEQIPAHAVHLSDDVLDDDAAPSRPPRIVGRFSGPAALIGSINCYGYLFAPTAFDSHLDWFRSHGTVAGFNHDWDRPAGFILGAEVVLRETDRPHLMVEAALIDTPEGLKVKHLVTPPAGSPRGAIRSLSIGHKVLQMERYDDPEKIEKLWASWNYIPTDEDQRMLRHLTATYQIARGLDYTPGVTVVNESRVFEVSPVLVPGQMGAGIKHVLSLIRDGALKPKPARRPVRVAERSAESTLEDAPSAPVVPDPIVPDPVSIALAERAAEAIRQARARL